MAAGLGVVEVVSPDLAALVVVDDGLVAGDQLLVVLAEGLGRGEAEGVAAAVGGAVVGQVELVNLWQLQVPPTDAAGLAAAAETAAGMAGVVVAGPNATVLADEEVWGVPQSPLNDPVYGGENGAGYRMIGVEEAWSYLRGSGLPERPTHIGFIDSGIWTGSGEFDGVTLHQPDPNSGLLTDPEHDYRVQVDGSWVDLGPDPTGGHGTSTAGIAVADGDDGGQVGIADPLEHLTVSTTNLTAAGLDVVQMVPADLSDEAQIAVGNFGVSFTTGVMQAIVGQVNDGARVINLSFGRTDGDPGTALMYRLFFTQMAARHPEVLFVGSAGNDNLTKGVVDGARRFPSGLDLPNMITVGNVNNDGTAAASSNRASANFEVDLAAPGEQAVQGVGPDGTVVNTYGGTSCAAPQVTAAAALLLSIKPDLTAEQIKDLLVDNARSEIVRDDGTTERIDGGVGGAVLAVDLAVRELVAQERAAAGLQPADISATELEGLGMIDAVAVSGDPGEWEVRGIIYQCDPGCTDVTISLSEGMAIGGDTTQHLDAAGEVTWSVTVQDYPASILVTRTNNGAASLITLQPPTLDGHYSGTLTYLVTDVPPEYGVDASAWVGQVALMEMDLITNPDGTGTANGTWTQPFDIGTFDWSAPATWTGSHIEFGIEFGGEMAEMVGTVSSTDDTVVIAGTWLGPFILNEEAVSTWSGVWELTRTG